MEKGEMSLVKKKRKKKIHWDTCPCLLKVQSFFSQAPSYTLGTLLLHSHAQVGLSVTG